MIFINILELPSWAHTTGTSLSGYGQGKLGTKHAGDEGLSQTGFELGRMGHGWRKPGAHDLCPSGNSHSGEPKGMRILRNSHQVGPRVNQEGLEFPYTWLRSSADRDWSGGSKTQHSQREQKSVRSLDGSQAWGGSRASKMEHCLLQAEWSGVWLKATGCSAVQRRVGTV